MILAEKTSEREETLKKLLPIQRSDFTEIFKVMEGLPVTIRLLDPPLHEFLPTAPNEIKVLAKQMNITQGNLIKKIEPLKELNPMLGLRGCRLGIIFPEIYRMQIRAVIEAACKLVKRDIKVLPEIMIPLVSHVNDNDIPLDQFEPCPDCPPESTRRFAIDCANTRIFGHQRGDDCRRVVGAIVVYGDDFIRNIFRSQSLL